MTDTPTTLAETVREILESFSGDLHVALPGVVESYDVGSLTADIRPGLKRYVPSRDDEAEDRTEPLPVLPGVPVVWPFGGGLFVHGGLVPGDSVLLVICSTDPGAWRASDGSQVDPSHPLRHGLGGAVAIPGLLRRGAEFTPDGASIGLNENSAQILFRSSQIRAGGTRTLARAANLDAHLDKIAQSLDEIRTLIALGTPTPDPNYGALAKALLDVSNPIPTSILRGD